MSSLPQLSGRHRRMVWLGVVWIGCGLIVIARLAWWQLFPHPDLRLYGQPGTGGVQTTPPIRGNILDANGHYLAVSTIGYKVGVSPDVLSNEERESLVPLVAELLDLDQNQVRSALATKGQAYVPLEIVKLYSFEQAHALSALSPAAFVLEPKFVRAYPDETLAASILGFLSAWKSEGNYGLEQYYERELKGVEGTWQGLDDAWGAQIPLGTDGYKPPENGADLTLTLDRNIQAIAETILKEGIEQNKGSSGNIIVLDPKTGAILAMANWPTYSPRDYGLVQDKNQYVNTAISWAYEPGSVFKPLTLAAALEARVIRPDDAYDDRGEIIVGGQRILNSDKKAHGRTTMTELLAYSRNVGAAHVATLLGPARFCEMIRRFGFGEITGVDLALEVPGSMRAPGSPIWHMSDLGTNSFGQGIDVTPLQVAAAYGALANDGWLMRPFVVSHVHDGKGLGAHKPVRVRPVISSQTSQQITKLMADAVELAFQEPLVPGYRFAAKSGTSQIPEQEGYQDKDVVASFVGFGPLPDPRFVILVKYDKPREGYWGSEVAAPAFSKLARYLVDYYGIASTQQQTAMGPSR
jgi:cell division protein FtsI (penicillin-binding protein 3)